MTKIIPFNEPLDRNNKIQLVLKILSLTFQILVLIIIAAGLLIYFIGFHNKPPAVEETEPCPNKYSGFVCDECGVIHNEPNVKIAGGIAVSNNSWPAAAFIVFDYYNYLRLNNSWFYLARRFFCGATLINRRTIITAGHCIIDRLDFVFRNVPYSIRVEPNDYMTTVAEMYSVYINAQDLNGWNLWRLPPPLLKIGVVEFTRHEEYNPVTYLNNIAVFKLSYEVELDHNTQLACLPDPSYDSYPLTLNVDGWITGWGENITNGTFPILRNQNAKVKIYDNSVCMASRNPFFRDGEKQLCAGSTAADICSADAGNALYVRDKVNGVDKFIMVGIASFGASCASGPPSVFTKVSAYRDWILHHVSY
ncbi:unnamed protein product [Brachionus calyciflorus]|uniref:Peptidase S1 domain-containing protein n=1 Tax=Brachionus calyciflorus TaxID=104777 RepID=A0A814A870_9BILA|nr:unnamed protein product [Brachionus calyciflorus]